MSRATSKAHALALLTLWSEAPALINGATREALQAFCAALDPNGDFETLALADLQTIAREWAREEYEDNHGS